MTDGNGRRNSGEFEQGAISARVGTLERQGRDAKAERKQIYEKLDEMGRTTAVILEKVERQGAATEAYMAQCVVCRSDIESLRHEVSTDVIKRKARGSGSALEAAKRAAEEVIESRIPQAQPNEDDSIFKLSGQGLKLAYVKLIEYGVIFAILGGAALAYSGVSG